MKEIENWLNQDELDKIYTSDYWNDIEEEKKKSWWIVDRDFEKCKDYLTRSGLLEEFMRAIELSGITVDPNDNLQVADIASGICWGSAILSQNKNIDKIHAVDISMHRLELLAPLAFEMFNGNVDKLSRYIGSFYKLKFISDSLDYIFLSQAFHHAEFPLKLLFECDRVLKPGGIIVIIGEHVIENKYILKEIIRKSFKKRTIVLDMEEILPSDLVSGDHYYPQYYYRFLFNKLGYTFSNELLKNHKRVIYYGKKQKL